MRGSNLAGRALAVLYALIVALAASGCAEKVAAPTAFASHSSQDGRFSCDYPKGWVAKGGGNSDFTWAKFTKGPAEINIDADLAGSLMGDIARSQANMFGGDASGENAPVADVHEQGLRRIKDDYDQYEEREPKTFQSAGFGEGRRSTFIAKKTLGGKLYGYRATLLAADRRLTVICRCPASNWHTLKPAFEKVIASLKSGGR